MPDAVLDAQTVSQRRPQWRRRLCDGDASLVTLVAESDAGQVVGFAAAGPERDGVTGFDSELEAIYLLATAQRQGAVRRLVAAAARGLLELGMHSMLAWVVAARPRPPLQRRARRPRGSA